MPRNTKGIGRTGSKHKNNAVADPDAQSTISEGVSGPPSNPVPQKTATAVDKVAAQTGPAPSVEDPVGDFSWLDVGRPATYVPCPHPRNADPSWNGFEQVGYRGHGDGFGDERWDPDVPPCVVSDKRPTGVFGSEEAAMAVEAARVREGCMPEKFVGDEGMYNEEEEEVARVRYLYALRRLAKAFPELEVPVPELCAGLQAALQCTRPCPCGVGLLARWPWVLQTTGLGFCSGGEWGEDEDSQQVETTPRANTLGSTSAGGRSGSWHALGPVRPQGRLSRNGKAPMIASRDYCMVPVWCGVREKNQGMLCIITRGQGGFRSWSLVFWNHQRLCFPHTIGVLAPFDDPNSPNLPLLWRTDS